MLGILPRAVHAIATVLVIGTLIMVIGIALKVFFDFVAETY